MMDVLEEKSEDRRKQRAGWRVLALALVFVMGLTAAPAKKHEPVTDDQIHDQVLMKLAGDIDVRGGAIDVEVHNGVVTLKGKIEKEKQRTRAERLAKKIKGVTSVENQLVLSPK